MANSDLTSLRTIRSPQSGSNRYPGFSTGTVQAKEDKPPEPVPQPVVLPTMYAKTLDDYSGRSVESPDFKGIHPGSYIGGTTTPYAIQPGLQAGEVDTSPPKAGGMCYVTTAIADNSDNPAVADSDLAVLKRWRDEVLNKSPIGRAAADAYYRTAPQITDRISSRPDAADVYSQLHKSYIRPAVDAINSGDDARAMQTYVQMVQAAKSAAQQPRGGEQGPEYVGQTQPGKLANISSTGK